MFNELICFVHGRGTRWEAICTDYDISVEGASPSEALQTLMKAVQSYIEDAMSEDATNRERLLNRRSPWRVEFMLRIRASLTMLKFRRGRDRILAGTFNSLCLV